MLNRIAQYIFGQHTLTDQQREAWERQGFLVFRSFFGSEQLASFENEVHQIIANRPARGGSITVDVLGGPYQGQRLMLAEAPTEVFDQPTKVNDLYLESEACRALALDPKLCAILGNLLGGMPMVINSLTFAFGRQQPHHFDTYYMPPPTLNRMVAASICLEDQTEETGPLSYYPGSHHIPPYRFSHGGLHAVDAEMEQATAYIQAEIAKRGLQAETFIGKAGDVIIWHGQLYHGGLLIKDPSRTRKTLVTHYWRAGDVQSRRVGKIGKSGSYLIREHQSA